MNKTDRQRISELLNKYKPNKQEIRELKGLVEFLEDQKDTGFIKSVLPELDKVTSSKNLDGQENQIISNLSKIEFIKHKIETLEKENRFIEFLMSNLEDETKAIFEDRFVNGDKIVAISMNHCISESTVYKMIREGYKSIASMLNKIA